MKARIGRCVLAFAAFAAIAGSQTESYDVRHVRWGMSVAEVKAAEPNARIFLGTKETHVTETDNVVGIDTFISYHFQNERLSGVSFLLSKPDPATAADADDFLYAWYAALNKKYGKGYICSGDSKICNLATLETLEAARKLYHNSKVRFTVQYGESERTHVFLCMDFDENKNPLPVTDFSAVPKDNF